MKKDEAPLRYLEQQHSAISNYLGIGSLEDRRTGKTISRQLGKDIKAHMRTKRTLEAQQSVHIANIPKILLETAILT